MRNDKGIWMVLVASLAASAPAHPTHAQSHEHHDGFSMFDTRQIDELMTEYGRVDILWLDGGWVRIMTDEEIRERRNRPDYYSMRLQSQDIDMARLVREAREAQPGLIVVDRAVPGPGAGAGPKPTSEAGPNLA